MSDNLTGSHRVRVFGPAMWEARKRWPRVRDRMEVRRHALKLRYWPEPHPHSESGVLLDLDWEWIWGLPGQEDRRTPDSG
jgi:hypothetical protein